ncbi:hypothetical protein DXT63_04905 [Thermoanaerobacteraceae bacterium SP2]|nr:hypothetical protein DXT63_04905 [Thermoanaerobacteraceae bacterium SP2]
MTFRGNTSRYKKPRPNKGRGFLAVPPWLSKAPPHFDNGKKFRHSLLDTIFQPATPERPEIFHLPAFTFPGSL